MADGDDKMIPDALIDEVEFVTKEDWLDLKLCVEAALVQTYDEVLHTIAHRLLKNFFYRYEKYDAKARRDKHKKELAKALRTEIKDCDSKEKIKK